MFSFAFLASSGSQVVATSPFFPTLTVYCSEVPFLGFSPCVAFVRATAALVTIAGTITAPILLLALRSAADVAGFFPSFAIFRASLGTSALS